MTQNLKTMNIHSFLKIGERSFGQFMLKNSRLKSAQRVRWFIHYAAWLKSGKSFNAREIEKAKQEMLQEARCSGKTEHEVCEEKDFLSIQDFFTRRLKDGVRFFPQGNSLIASPVDGTIAGQGMIHLERLVKVKGELIDFAKLAMLHPEEIPLFQGGQFIDLYLAPYNYHRYHSPYPQKLILKELVEIGGREKSVSGNRRQILERNVRLIAKFKDENENLFIIVFVAALGVSRMEFLGHLFETPTRLNYQKIYQNQDLQKLFDKNEIIVESGEDLGTFMLGSTVVLLAPKGQINFGKQATGSSVQVGQVIGSLVE